MGVHTLVFTDLVDSTGLVERLGDERAAQVWAGHDRRARALLARHRGREIDRTDGFFLLFDDAAAAACFALAYLQAMSEFGLSARVGLHEGAVSLRENDPDDVARGAKRTEVEGLAKPFAARVMALARGGQILLSASARAALGGKLPEERAVIESHGHYRLKGVELPVEIFELGPGDSAFTPPADTEKAYRVVRDGEHWRPLREVRHNLAPERDAFIGRSTELRALAHRIDQGSRLLTLLGPGGTGKTRLARRYGLAWLGDWPGGVYFCDLSEARSLDGIYFAVAIALGVPLGKDDPGVQLGHSIAGRGRCLMILDNFEQVVGQAPRTLGRWLDRAADATFIVTSRERLQLAGEEIFPIEPLELGHEAIELFETRARAQRPTFTLDASNKGAVAEVVRLLDGLPLAIELAAARVRVLSPAQIVERMAQRFQLLAGAKGVAARQATLKAAIDWSWELLTPWEQAALAQCSVFDGGFTLNAAEAVLDLGLWPEAPPAMDAIEALVDKSLLRAWRPAEHRRLDLDEPYFGMYLSIHEYAAGRLQDHGVDVADRARERHGNYFAGFGTETAIESLSRHGGGKRQRALAMELDNVVCACRRAIERGAANVAAANYCAAWEVMARQGPFGICVALSAQVLALDGIEPRLRVQSAVSRADALMRVGALQEARDLLDELLVQARDLADRKLEGIVLGDLGQLHREQGRMGDAKRCLEDALAIFGDLEFGLGQGTVLHNLGNVHDQLGSPAESRTCHERALAIFGEIGNRAGAGRVLAGLAILNRHQGRMDEAQAHYQSALAIHRELGDRRAEGIALGNLANVLMDLGHVREALAHYEAALVIHREVGSRVVEGVTLANLGNVHSHLGRIDDAHSHHVQALAICREMGNRWQEGVVLTGLAAVEVLQGRMTWARAYIDQALQVNHANGNRCYEGMAFCCLGDLLTRQQRLPEAMAALRQGEALLREVDNPVELANLLCVRGRASLSAGELEPALAALAEAEAIANRIGATADSGLERDLAKLRALLGSPEPRVPGV
jgi:predicted ATPase/class 3 adenylate cyclase